MIFHHYVIQSWFLFVCEESEGLDLAEQCFDVDVVFDVDFLESSAEEAGFQDEKRVFLRNAFYWCGSVSRVDQCDFPETLSIWEGFFDISIDLDLELSLVDHEKAAALVSLLEKILSRNCLGEHDLF